MIYTMSLVKFDVTRNSPKWTLNSSGNLQSGSGNLPGFEFNVDNSYKGVLVEESRKNLCFQSEDFGTTWGGVSGLDLNATTAPDGTSTADRIRGDALGGGDTQLYRNQTITVTTEEVYTASVFAKEGALSWIRIGDGGSNPYAFFDLSNGVVGTSNGTDDESIEDYGNGWYRCSITWTQAAGDTTFLFRISIAEDDNDVIVPRLPSSASSVFLWGAQVEKGDKASSYIKTTNQTETRNEDVITLTSASQYLPSEGKVTFGWEQKEDDTIYIGVFSASISSGSRELVYEYSSTEQTLSIDGTEVQTVTGQFDFSGMDKIELGHLSGSDQPNTHLKYFAVE